MSFDHRALRDAFGCFPTGVAVVTAGSPRLTMGITVNSFASVSLDPPLVLWCLARHSDRFETFLNAAGSFDRKTPVRPSIVRSCRLIVSPAPIT